MKKILLIALLCLVIGSMVGCDTLKSGIFGNDNNDGDDSKTPTPTEDAGHTELKGAVMKYISSDDKTLTVELENDTDSVWQSGNMRDYALERESDGKWYTVEPKGDFANTMELMLFGPGDKLVHTFDFSERYGVLAAGKYRVVKSWWANATDTTEAGEFYLTLEFSVE